MTWDVKYTDEFGSWWVGFTEAEQESVVASVQLLEQKGPVFGASAQQRHQGLKAWSHA